MVKLPLSKLDELFSIIGADKTLYVPVDVKGESEFKVWEKGVALSRKINTRNCVRKLFFPQSENLVDFKLKGKEIEIDSKLDDGKEFVVFGVSACDARSLEILDLVFLSEPKDSFYSNKRSKGVVVTTSCTRITETCFCTSFNIDATEPKGDVTTWMSEEYIYFKSNTKKGEDLLSGIQILEKVNDEDVKVINRHKEEIKGILDKLPIKLNVEQFNKENMMGIFNSDKWSELSESCLACGTCTFVCPTCQCYDIFDYDTGNGVKRYRCWDSCMYSDFTLMAHGNPRLSQVERFRQRFMHKLVYFPSNNDGVYGCVGCGRCLQKCPVSMNIVKVAKSIGGDFNG